MSVLRFDPFGDPFRQLDRMASQMMSGTRTPLGMPMDVWQADDGYHIALDLPGVDPGSVDITCERNVLTIRAERRPLHGEDDEVLVAERPQGGFTRQLQVGEALDTENIQADYRDGVLSLLVPVARAAQPRRIEVRHERSPRAVPEQGEQQQLEQRAEQPAATQDQQERQLQDA